MSDQKTGCPASPACSFTLPELLVSLAVASVFLAAMFGIFSQSTKAWSAAERQADAFREARAALHFLRQDLLHARAGPSLRFHLNDSSLLSHLPAKDQTGASVFFVCVAPPAAQQGKSDLCEVGYYCAFTPDSGGKSRFNLYRYFQNSDATFSNLLASSLFQPFPHPDLPQSELVARNICRLEMTAFPPPETGLWPVMTNALPMAIDVEMDVLNDATAVRLGNERSDWTEPRPLILANRQTFRTRVPLLNRP
jgi:prepilin-type N-terminal cleavage/methylation domain-containing protein